MLDVEAVLGPQGLLARVLPGYAWRRPQQEMAEAVAEALETGERLIAEAGTGTGKTYAYLVPALLSGLRVIVSTGTRNLQDQLFQRDLPRLRDALGSPVRVALLKGRANYLCRYRMETALLDPRGHRPEVAAQLQIVQRWSTVTRSGDIAELGELPEEAPVWPLVTSSGDNCLGSECPQFERCHLVEARRRAQEAELVVVNHHLLCADFALKGEGFGELLPGADAYIIDEAHQLPEVASNFFGDSVGTRQFLELCRDARADYVQEAGDLPKLLQQIDHLEKAARDFRLAFGEAGQRGAWEEVADDPDVQNGLAYLEKELAEFHGMLEAIAGRGKGLDNCRERAKGLMSLLAQICHPDEEGERIRWYEVHSQSLRLNSTPLEVAGLFRQQMARHADAWIFTSATLAVGESFEHFQRQLGIDEARTRRWESPFDYAKQALWFVPRGLPDPNAANYTTRVAELALPLIEASRGRAFLLFTSHRALQKAAEWLASRTELPLLVQGSAPKAELLERFVELGNAVLLGTSSFWEGVDVRGEALSLVVIDKLPFASPGDPVLKARLEAIRKRGGNPFMHHQLPQAVIALKQGAGRLIRDVNDRGVLVVCDPRLLRRNYGHIFLEAMPDFGRTRELERAIGFLAQSVSTQAV